MYPRSVIPPRTRYIGACIPDRRYDDVLDIAEHVSPISDTITYLHISGHVDLIGDTTKYLHRAGHVSPIGDTTIYFDIEGHISFIGGFPYRRVSLVGDTIRISI